MRILLTIPSLTYGGAERQLITLANGLHKRGHVVRIVAFSPGDGLESQLAGPTVVTLNKTSRAGNLLVLLKLSRIYRRFKPDIAYSFLATPNIMGAILRPLHHSIALVMGVRASEAHFTLYRYSTAGRIAARVEALMSHLAQAIAVNSHSGRALCLQRDFPESQCTVIFNGIDTALFHPDKSSRTALRTLWGCGDQDTLIGLPARLDPIKHHPNFLRAGAQLASQHPRLRFLCVGGGAKEEESQLVNLANTLGISSRLIMTGSQQDMCAVYNALDLVCLSSLSEGFPNVLGEAMACGVPCVTTDVGDAALVVGETGVVVPKGDPEALALGMLRQLDRLEREGDALRTACRERIVTQFSVERMVSATEALLQDLCREGR